jgi:alpha-glucosidase (family GH31 glycosyl hydrolase)
MEKVQFRQIGQETKPVLLMKICEYSITEWSFFSLVYCCHRYGTHPFYIEHRYTSDPHPHSQTHGVFLNSAAGADILLLSPPGTGKSLIEYRLLGGTLDLYFFSGPSPQEVVEQYSQVVGQPTWMPLWAFGSQLCRWGYKTVNETWDVVKRMREANIPLEGDQALSIIYSNY